MSLWRPHAQLLGVVVGCFAESWDLASVFRVVAMSPWCLMLRITSLLCRGGTFTRLFFSKKPTKHTTLGASTGRKPRRCYCPCDELALTRLYMVGICGSSGCELCHQGGTCDKLAVVVVLRRVAVGRVVLVLCSVVVTPGLVSAGAGRISANWHHTDMMLFVC